LIVDFDNTAVAADVGDAVADRFGDPRWRDLEVAHQRGETSLAELLRFMFESMRVEEEELVAFAREAGRLRPGFEEFVEAAKARGDHLVLASGGLDVYIRAILGTKAAAFEIFCNQASFRGGRVEVEFPYLARGCGNCGNCKRAIVEELRARGFGPLVAIGDGVSDRCMAESADRTIARGPLLVFCEGSGVPVVPFEDFYDVMRALGI
jgi:2,3-diketo-5-methylthio-1-phosphopentane phosphatase